MPSRDPKTGRFVRSRNGSPDGMRINRSRNGMEDLLANAMLERSELFSRVLDPRRSINDECGYPETGTIRTEEYREFYDREPVATRVVEVMPRESWQAQPTVFEVEEEDRVTDFEQRWSELGNSLRGTSWYQDEEGNPIWEYLLRADILSGIGSFGVLLIGIDDGQPLDAPVPQVEQWSEGITPTEHNLLYLRAFDEALLQINRYETDLTNPRFGQPINYLITLTDPNTEYHGGIGQPLATYNVHWTRVVHIADNLGSSDIFGAPRMRPVYNRLHDLRKLYSGSAEMYWRGAFPGLAFETQPELGGDVDLNTSTMRTQMEQYMNGLQRYLALPGLMVKSIAPQVVDPTPQIDTQIEAICIRLGIPKRIFVGSERGDLASSQDDSTWNDRLYDRQHNYLTPRLIIPFVDRLIMLGVLPEPEGYSVKWPDLNSLSEDEQATIAVKRTEAMSKYVGAGIENLIQPMDYLTRVLHFNRNEAEAIIEATLEAMEEREQQAEQQQAEEEGIMPGQEGEVVEEEEEEQEA